MTLTLCTRTATLTTLTARASSPSPNPRHATRPNPQKCSQISACTPGAHGHRARPRRLLAYQRGARRDGLRPLFVRRRRPDQGRAAVDGQHRAGARRRAGLVAHGRRRVEGDGRVERGGCDMRD
eukprot:1812522-Prymnesium_polylepis.2